MLKTSEKVSVVILNWNNYDVIGKCLDSVLRQSYKNLEVIVVDNASRDGSREMIQSRYPRIILLPQAKNLGFAGGVNRGIESATGDYIALLNSDAVADPDWIANLLDGMLGEAVVGACASKMLDFYDKKKIDSAGIRIFTTGRASDRGYGELDVGQYDCQEEIFGASAGAAMYRTRVFEEIGGLDEEFFVYLEDVDLAWRMRNAGFKTLYCPKAVVYHIRSYSTSKTSRVQRYYGARNRVLLLLKNMPRIQLIANLPFIMLFEAASVLHDTVKYQDFSQVKGKWDAMRRYFKIRKRWRRNCKKSLNIRLMESPIKQLVFEIQRLHK